MVSYHRRSGSPLASWSSLFSFSLCSWLTFILMPRALVTIRRATMAVVLGRPSPPLPCGRSSSGVMAMCSVSWNTDTHMVCVCVRVCVCACVRACVRVCVCMCTHDDLHSLPSFSANAIDSGIPSLTILVLILLYTPPAASQARDRRQESHNNR